MKLSFLSKPDYKKQLEDAARQMILIHRVDTLSRLILRTILRSLKVSHAGIFLYDKTRDEYVIRVSKGQKGHKVPVGFAKIKKDNPLLQYFTNKKYSAFKQDFILYDRIKYYLKSPKAADIPGFIDLLKKIDDEFSLYQAKAFVPGFFRNELNFILFLGSKQDKTAFTDEELGFLSVLSSDIVMALKNASLFDDLRVQLASNKKLFLNTVTALANAIEAKDKYTLGHTARVVRYSLEIAKYIFPHDHLQSKVLEEELRIAALLHDIGKIGIPEKVLNKQDSLTAEERNLINTHPAIGVDILSPVSEFSSIIDGVKYHHERYDGNGYPDKLSGDKIPLVASIISVADSYDAMTTDRPYRKALSYDEAVKEIKKNSGKQFNPKIVEAFLRAYNKSPESFAERKSRAS